MHIEYEYPSITFTFPYDEDIDLSPAKVERHEARWREIKEKYKSVRVYLLYGLHALAEFLYRYFAMCEEPQEDGVLHVVLPTLNPSYRGLRANVFAERYVSSCGEEDIDFWSYVLLRHRDEVNEPGDLVKFTTRSTSPAYFKKAYSIEHHFTDEQVERGEEALKAMGVTGPFVCLAARTDKYKLAQHRGTSHDEGKLKGSERESSIRNMDFRDYGKAIAWLGEQGIQCVKMGRFEEPIAPIPNCIDYTAFYADDFMDLYTFSRCEFAISTLHGITALANLFAKPLLVVDVAVFSIGSGASRYTEHDRFLTKRFYARDGERHRMKRPLSLRKMFDIAKDPEFRSSLAFESVYRKRGIELSDNTEDEILDAVKEMVARLDGTWADTDEDQELIEGWWGLYDEMEAFQAANGGWSGGPLPFPPATTFLRKHPYLVE